jgi:hypothetical protein
VIDVVRRATCFGRRAAASAFAQDVVTAGWWGGWQWGSSVCETLDTNTLSATCQDAQRRAHDVLGLFLSAFAFSLPWRRRQVVWWWHAGATLDGVGGSDFFPAKGQAVGCLLPDERQHEKR